MNTPIIAEYLEATRFKPALSTETYLRRLNQLALQLFMELPTDVSVVVPKPDRTEAYQDAQTAVRLHTRPDDGRVDRYSNPYYDVWAASNRLPADGRL